MFNDATTTAPADADFVIYASAGGYTLLARDPSGAWDVAAGLTKLGLPLISGAIYGTHKSLWSYDSRKFLVGSVEQLDREA